jgi:hypothetical protein
MDCAMKITEKAVATYYGVVDAWGAVPADERRAWRAAVNAVIEECAKVCDLSMAELLLLAGEMGPPEKRTVMAVLQNRARVIRALKDKP